MDEGKETKIFRFAEASTSLALNIGENFLYAGTKRGNILSWNLNSIHPTPEKVVFDRLAIDKEGEKTVHIESAR